MKESIIKVTSAQKSIIRAMRLNSRWLITLDRQSYTFYFRDDMKMAYTTHLALLNKGLIEQSLNDETKTTFILSDLGKHAILK